MTVRSSTRGLPGLPRGRCGLSAFQASSDSQNKLFAMTIALQRLKSSANISSKSTSCMGSLPKPRSILGYEISCGRRESDPAGDARARKPPGFTAGGFFI